MYIYIYICIYIYIYDCFHLCPGRRAIIFPPDGVFDVGHFFVKYVIIQKVFRLFTSRNPLVRTFLDAQNDQ